MPNYQIEVREVMILEKLFRGVIEVEYPGDYFAYSEVYFHAPDLDAATKKLDEYAARFFDDEEDPPVYDEVDNCWRYREVSWSVFNLSEFNSISIDQQLYALVPIQKEEFPGKLATLYLTVP